MGLFKQRGEARRTWYKRGEAQKFASDMNREFFKGKRVMYVTRSNKKDTFFPNSPQGKYALRKRRRR